MDEVGRMAVSSITGLYPMSNLESVLLKNTGKFISEVQRKLRSRTVTSFAE